MRSNRGEEYYDRYTKNGQTLDPFAKVFFLQKWDCCLILNAWLSRLKCCGQKKKFNFLQTKMLVRSMVSNYKLPKFFWIEAFNIVAYILN